MDEDDELTTLTGDVEEGPEVEVEASPVIVVEDAPEAPAAETPAEVDRAIDTAERLVALEMAVASLVEDVAALQSAAAVQEVVEEAQGEVIADLSEEVATQGEVLAETAADTMGDEAPDLDGDGKPDEPPMTARKHWVFRSMSDWRNK